MHGWGQWYVPAAAAVIAGGYLCGRRDRTGVAVALIVVIEVAAAIAVAVTQDVLSWLGDQAVVVLAVFAAVTGAYRRLRHEYAEQGWAHARDARLHERARIAADLHDTLGHDLALLSLQAAGIQVTATDDDTRQKAAAMRSASAAAIETVRRIVDLLDVSAEPDAAAVLGRAREAGMDLRVTGAVPGEPFTARLLAEALSNAVRHAPGAPVSVTFTGRRVRVENPLAARPTTDRTGSGLAMLSERLDRAGGWLRTETAGGSFRLSAVVPAGMDRDGLTADHHHRRHRLRRMLAGTVVIPGAVLLVVASGFYAWAVRDASMDDRAFAELSIGMPSDDAARLLPRRQAPVRFGAVDEPGCRYYTDGNFPLAYGNYQVCLSGGRVSRLRDSTGRDR